MEALHAEAVTMMLFLRNVESVEVLDWRQGDTAPRSQFTCSLSNISSRLRSERSLFSMATQAANAQQTVQGSHRLEFVVSSADASDEHHAFLVSQLKGTSQRVVELSARATKTFGAPAVPWGAVAARLPSDSGTSAGAGVKATSMRCTSPWLPAH